jgi:phospholipase C
LDAALRGRSLAVLASMLLIVSPSFPLSVGNAQTMTPFKHVIIVVQENHSFDNYFGTYPTANGTLNNNVASGLTRVNGIPDGVCSQHGGSCVSPRLSTSSSPVNPNEGQATYEADYSPNSSFAKSSGPQSMVYFDYHSIPAYWDYAEEYGLADNYFAAVLSMTTPNRLILMTGGTPVSANYGPPPYIPYNETVFGQLDDAGVSWGYYDLINGSVNPVAFYPLNYISGLDRSATSIRNVSTMFNELASGQGLPSVSYVSFLGNLGLTEHPPYSTATGEAQVVSLINGVMSSTYWDSTLIFVTWDEGGGFYDHVQPPWVFALNRGFSQDLHGLGQRVPLLAISPFSKVNFVSHVLTSHLSLLHFIEYNWNLPPINSLVGDSNLPLDFFDFSLSPRPGIILSAAPNTNISYPIPQQEVTHAGAPMPASLSFLNTLPVIATVLGIACVFLYSRRTSTIKFKREEPATVAQTP